MDVLFFIFRSCIHEQLIMLFLSTDLFNFVSSFFQSPSSVWVHPSGVELSLNSLLSVLRKCHGDQQGKQFRVWVDSVITTQVGPGTWFAKFHKWESFGKLLYISLSKYKGLQLSLFRCLFPFILLFTGSYPLCILLYL